MSSVVVSAQSGLALERASIYMEHLPEPMAFVILTGIQMVL